MARDLLRSLLVLLALTAICGVAYPLVVWGVGRVAFADAADGSLIRRDGVVVGSARIGQPFAGEGWFQGRPSAVGNATVAAGEAAGPAASGGSNLGPTSAELASTIARRIADRAALEGIAPADVPVDLVTTSASGLDPDISKASALVQVNRVARVHGLDPAAVRELVEGHVQGSTLGFLGSERVNVLRLNLALEGLAG